VSARSADIDPSTDGFDGAGRAGTVIFVTQVLDPDDPVLGFVPIYLRPLSARVDRLVVIANEVRAVPPDLDAEVLSLGKEHGYGRARRLARYQSFLSRYGAGSPSAVMAHMCPIYLSLAAPVGRLHAMRMLLWFAHPADTWRLRVAERVADAVVTTSPGSYPHPSAKLHCIGQGIDVQTFAASPATDGPLRLLALGRTSPDKGYPVLIEAVAKVIRRGTPVELRIVGSATTPAEHRHRSELERLVADAGLTGQVIIEAGVPHAEVPELIAGSSVLVNTTVDGSCDKTVFEAAACGRVVLASSRSFEAFLSGLSTYLRYRPGDVDQLADRIVEVGALSLESRRELGLELRDRVVREHSNLHWAEQVAALATQPRTTASSAAMAGKGATR
jgi:glycosyltransferase involved in cell wall biosynthesis